MHDPAASPRAEVSPRLSGLGGHIRELVSEKVLTYLQDTCVDGSLRGTAASAGRTPGRGESSHCATGSPGADVSGDTLLSSFATEFSRKSSSITRRLISPFPLCPKCKIITTATTVSKGEGNKHSDVTLEPRERTPWPGSRSRAGGAGTWEGGREGARSHWVRVFAASCSPCGRSGPGLTHHAQEQTRKCRVSRSASSGKFHG